MVVEVRGGGVQLDTVHFDKDDAYIMMDLDPENPSCRKELKRKIFRVLMALVAGGWSNIGSFFLRQKSGCVIEN